MIWAPRPLAITPVPFAAALAPALVSLLAGQAFSASAVARSAMTNRPDGPALLSPRTVRLAVAGSSSS
ncbi:MAG TPA: hypothetical protein VIY52_21640 [Streptosporangiaceae bacterium]